MRGDQRREVLSLEGPIRRARGPLRSCGCQVEVPLDALTAPITSLLDEQFPGAQKETGFESWSPRQVYGWWPQGVGLRDTPRAVGDEIKQHIAIERCKKTGRASGQWASHFDACIDCNTTERPHRANGRCKRCDDRWRYAQGQVPPYA